MYQVQDLPACRRNISTFSPPPSPPILIISSCPYKLSSLSPLPPFAFRISFTCVSYAARLEIHSTLYITWTPTSATIWLAGQSRDAPYAISALLRQATSTPFAPFIGASPSRRPIPHHLPKVKYLQPRIVHDVRELNASCCIFFYSTLKTILNILHMSAFVSSSVGPCPRLMLLPSLRRLLVTSTYRARLLGLIKYNASYFFQLVEVCILVLYLDRLW